ncbi:MAG: hypothetical protein ABIA93_02755 [Candidatus Woesearchaeota archaeon]
MKYFVAVLIAILLAASATAVTTTEYTKPTIHFEYDETVTFINAVFTDSFSHAIPFTRSPSTSTSTKYSIQPIDHLSNGAYTIIITVTDAIGNARPWAYEFEIDRPFLGIKLLKPKYGVSPTSIFDLVLQTTDPAQQCKYTLNPALPFVSISNPDTIFQLSADRKTHSILGFDDMRALADNQPYPIYVKCQDQLGITNDNDPERFDLAIDRTVPLIRVRADPANIIETPETTIIVDSDDPVICKYDLMATTWNQMQNKFAGFDNATFSRQLKQKFLGLTDKTTTTYNVMCMNGAELYSALQKVTFTVDLGAAPKILTLLPKGYVNTAKAALNVTTNKNSQCQYLDGTKNIPFDNTWKKNHVVITETLEQGKHTFTVTCQFEQGGSDTGKIEFTLDTVGPTNTSLKAPSLTCGNKNAWFNYTGTDPAGIGGVNYTLTGTNNTVLQSGITADNPVKITATLKDGITYTVTARVRDTAGNQAGPLQVPIHASSSNRTECDTTPPTTNAILIPDNTTVKVNVTCTDSGSGCTNSFIYSLVALNEKCTPTTSKNYGTLILATKSGKFCWEASDKNGNKMPGTKLITIGGNACSNGVKDTNEQGVDCGGPCQACDVNQTCTFHSDCASGLCLEGTCQAGTCTDNIKNQDESDVDCGGVCPSCPLNKQCDFNSDCTSGYCKDDKCAEASCTDGIKDGNETGVDCGGNCPACSGGVACKVDADCESGFCDHGTCQDKGNKDTDGDGMPDVWETRYGLNPNDPNDAGTDLDGDGLTNLEEYRLGTDPTNRDTDGDGRDDLEEVNKGTQPTVFDKFGPGLLPLLLLIIGILLIVSGGGYLIYSTYFQEDPRSTSPRIVSQRTQNPNVSQRKIETIDPKERRLQESLKQSRIERRTEQRKQLFGEFEEEDSVDTAPLKPAKATEKPKESPLTQHSVSKPSDEFVTVEELQKRTQSKPKQDPTKPGEDAFQELEDLVEKAEQYHADKKIVQPVQSTQPATKKQIPKPEYKPQQKTVSKQKAPTAPKKPMTNEEIFNELASMADSSKTAVRQALGGKTVRKSEAKKLFATVQKREDLDMDVFEAILSSLVSKGKVTKQTVNEILFEFKDRSLLNAREVEGLRGRLKIE